MSLSAFVNDKAKGQAARVFLQDASPSDWARLLAHARTRHFASGDVLVQRGDADRSMFIVLEGQLEILVAQDAGERAVSIAGPGSIFGEQSFLDGETRSAAVRAVSEGEVRILSWPDFQQLAADAPDLGMRVLVDIGRTLSDRLRRTSQANPANEGGADDE